MRVRQERQRKAVVTVDMAVGMVIFLSMITLAFYYITYLSAPKQPFDIILKDRGITIAEALRENASWTVFLSPIRIDSPASVAWNNELVFWPDSSVDTNSVAVLDANMTAMPSAFSDNSVIWVSNISAGKNIFYLTYTKSTALPTISYSTDLNSSGLSANNSAMKALFDSTGIASINFSGAELLGGGIDLGTSGTPENTAYAVRAKINYSDGVSAVIYSNLSKIVISSNHTINPILYLSAGFTDYYNGTANAFSSSGEQFNSILNFTDIYSSSSGAAVIGRNMNISVRNATYREIRIYNTTEFEIYLHAGNYAEAIPERDVYLNMQPAILGLPQEVKGVSLAGLAALASVPYSDLRDKFGAGSNFNVTLNGFGTSIGKKIPADRNVFVVEQPAAVLGRLGNISEAYFNVAVWMGTDNS